MQSFEAHNQTYSLKLNALLLTPAQLDVKTRRQTAVGIQRFTETHKTCLGIIVYLMDGGASGNEQMQAVQSLGELHHCLSLGYAEPPPILVVSDASYLLDCIGAYMRGVSRANPVSQSRIADLS
jgi:hypothetical protein